MKTLIAKLLEEICDFIDGSSSFIMNLIESLFGKLFNTL